VGTFERKQQHIFGIKLCAKHLQNFQILMAVDRHIHNSHFTDPLFELSQTEYEIGQYNTTQYKNLIAQYNLVISPTAIYSLQNVYYKLLQIIVPKILHT